MLRPAIQLALVACVVASTTARAANINESFFGDLSNFPATPSLTPEYYHGSHNLVARSGRGDIDFLRVTIPTDHYLETLTLVSYGGVAQSFVGIQAGTQWTAGTGDSVNPALLLGWSYFGTTAAGAGPGQDVLDNMAASEGSIGFSTPLGPGSYTMMFEDTGAAFVNWTMRFFVTLVESQPIPGDFNEDRFVDGNDLFEWKLAYGLNDLGDADGNGISDGNDILIWQRYFNVETPIAAIPEPSGAILAAAGALAAVATRLRVSP